MVALNDEFSRKLMRENLKELHSKTLAGCDIKIVGKPFAVVLDGEFCKLILSSKGEMNSSFLMREGIFGCVGEGFVNDDA